MTSAPRVNQIRLLSSVAFENAPKLMLAASCSAADAMYPSYPKRARARPFTARIGRYLLVVGRLPLWPTLALLRRGLRLGCGTAEQDDLAARCFDRLDRRLGGARHLDRDRRAEGAFRQKADAVARAAQDASRHELCGVEPALGGELAGIDRLLQAAEID